MQNKSGLNYFLSGFSLITTKGIKRFVFIPLAVNILLFSIAFYFLYGEIAVGITWLMSLIPSWLDWLKTLLSFFLWPLAVITVLLVFALIFGTLANWIAAPFNGVLSEKLERHLTGHAIGDESLLALVKDVPRMLGREFSKFAWYVPRALFFLLLFFLLPVVGQVLWFMFNAWMMAIQYCDYPYDNHKVSFKSMREHLSMHKGKCFSFGVGVSLFSLIPLLNFIVMPVAVCGATAMWVDELKPDLTKR